VGRGYFSGVHWNGCRRETDDNCDTRVARRAPAAAASEQPVAAQFSGLYGLFAHYPVLTLIPIVPGLLFMLLGPLQFSSTILARHLRWHRWSGRVFVGCGFVIGISALVMSFGIPAIGGVNQAAATTLFGTYFLLAPVEGILADPPERNCAAPRVDDSGILDWAGGGYDPAHCGDIFCDEALVGTDAAGVFWYRILD
jgi:hypothetical protein